MRFRALTTLVLLLFSSAIAKAQDPTQVFNEAVSAYQRGDFDSAAVGFTQLVDGGIDDVRVWYNLGNAHFKSGRIGHALTAYRRGLRLAPRDVDLVANYRYVRLFAVDKIEPVGELFLEQWWNSVVDRLSAREAQWIAGLLFWVAVVITVWRLRPMAGLKALPTWMIVGVWTIWLLATGAAATSYARTVASKDGYIVIGQTDVRGGPGDEYALQFIAHDGLEGTVERTESGWHLVRFPNGLKGWLAASSFEIL